MANKDNKLSHLKIDDKKWEQLDLLFQMQSSLQSNIALVKGISDITEKNPKISFIADWMLKNKHAMDDEFSEMMDALGGIEDGIGSAAWKWWKAENKIASDIHLSNLSEKDRLELKFEAVDMLHFFLNMCILLGMTGSEVMNMYIAKNAENLERQKIGY